MSIFADVLFYANWVICVVCWLFWDYQILRSAYFYWKHEKKGAFDIICLHVLLFIANFLFLLYEVNVTFTPVYLTMFLITDITGIWCYLLISQNDGDGEKMMDTKSGWFVNLMIVFIIAVYVSSYFLPDHYGVKCTKHSSPLAALILCVFYIIWTIFTVYTISNDPLLKTKEHSYGDLWATTKQLCFKEYEGEYDHHGMVLAQRQMFMITTMINLIIQIALFSWQFFSYFYALEFDESVKSQCTDRWHFQDSTVTMTLMCYIISMPIQQFTSCFYVIPMEHKFFEQTKDQMVAEGAGIEGDIEGDIKKVFGDDEENNEVKEEGEKTDKNAAECLDKYSDKDGKAPVVVVDKLDKDKEEGEDVAANYETNQKDEGPSGAVGIGMSEAADVSPIADISGVKVPGQQGFVLQQKQEIEMKDTTNIKVISEVQEDHKFGVDEDEETPKRKFSVDKTDAPKMEFAEEDQKPRSFAASEHSESIGDIQFTEHSDYGHGTRNKIVETKKTKVFDKTNTISAVNS